MMRYHADDRIPTLKAALTEHMNGEDLKRLGAHTKQKLPGRKAEIAAVILDYLAGERLQKVWQRLDTLQQAAVAEVVHSASPRFPADRFRAKYGGDPDWGTSDKYGYRRNPSLLGFFFYGKRVMPDDLKARLEAFVPPPAAVTIQTVAQLPATCELHCFRRSAKAKHTQEVSEAVPLEIHHTETAAQRELLAVLRLIDAGKVVVSDKTRRPSAAAIATITGVLEGGDFYPVLAVAKGREDENAGPIRAFAWPLLVQAGGLAQLSGTRLQLTRAGRKALAQPAAETLRNLWDKWRHTTLIDELARIECVKGQTGKKGKHGLTAVSSRRDAISVALAESPGGVWIATDEFFRFLRASGIDFSVSEDPWHLYIGDPHYGSLGYAHCGSILEERYLYAFLLEYAATLGIIDVALVPPAGARHNYHDLWGADDLVYFNRYDGLMFLRVTPLGAYCLGAEDAYRPAPLETRPVLHVLPNLEVAAIGAALEPGDRIALDTYATRLSDLVWRLEPDRLLAAMDAGRPIHEIREFLEARSGAAIPATVTRLLDDIAERSTKIRERGLARLVECADAALAALIANDSRIGKHCLQAGERHLVVPAASEAAFKRNLREAGYLLAAGETRPVPSGPKAGSRKKAAED